MIILPMLEYIWEEPWLNTWEVIGNAHVTVGPQKKRFYRCPSLPLIANLNKMIEALLDRWRKGEDLRIGHVASAYVLYNAALIEYSCTTYP